MIKFTQITDKLNYPAKIKAELSTLHSEVITYTIAHFRNTTRYKSNVIGVLNTLSYYLICGDSLPTDWDKSDPFVNLDLIDSSLCDEVLGQLYLHVKDVVWDIEESDTEIEASATKHDVKDESSTKSWQSLKEKIQPEYAPPVHSTETPKEHLYIRPPVVPQFDITKPWLKTKLGGELYTIYTSIPEIPTNQSEISVTTDVSKMVPGDLIKLYPNCFIKTRSAIMYQPHDGLTLDEDVGILIPIQGFSPKQVKENIIKYPHIFKLMRMIDDRLCSFYSHIEIDGELRDTLSVWDELPESKKIPRNSEFIKEYVVRRYLLERDIKHVKHKYPLYGSLDPFLTLFSTKDDYIRWGYDDPVDLAKQCVKARVEYKRTRNPIMKAVYNG